MDHRPSPFFKRGPAPLAQLSFYVALSLALIVVDARFQTLEVFRQALSVLTNPVQKIAQTPVALLRDTGHYFADLSRLQEENLRLQNRQLNSAKDLMRTQQLEAENERLRKLLEIKTRQKMAGHVAQIISSARDPFSRRVVIDKGLQDKIEAGQPVIDEFGLAGQVTRVFPFVAEVSLITDREQSVPVQIMRTGLRSVVFGLGNGQLELRFMPANADVQEGDILLTSGLDGVFLPGLPVAKIVHIERDRSLAFARIFCEPIAGVENFGEVLVLDARETRQIPPELKSDAPSKPASKLGLKRKRVKAKR